MVMNEEPVNIWLHLQLLPINMNFRFLFPISTISTIYKSRTEVKTGCGMKYTPV